MLYPTIKQYLDALRLAEDNFDQLASYRIVNGVDGNPVMSGGNFAVVFKMQDSRDGSFHAVKCFLKDQPGRTEAYHLIADELEQVTSSYLARILFLERELFVDTGNGGAEYPVLVMDWVEGITLDRYLRQHISDPYALGMLAYHFARLGAWLLTQPFAHGDLKPDNILVRPDGTLVLVDYDGMYVPAMQGQRALEAGTPDFRHPLRTDADFNEHIDDFPLASILLSLRAVAYCPDYLDRYGASDRLLLSESDYRSPEQSAFLRDEFPSPDAELNRIYALFLLALSERTLSQVSFRLFNLAKPAAPPPPVVVNTDRATKDEIANGIRDGFGVVYSPDGTELLECSNYNLESYQVKEGCKVIRGSAFYWCMKLTDITLPARLTHIGDGAFYWCMKLTAITLPAGMTHIWDDAFWGCEELTAITLPASLTHIGDGAFASSGIRSVVNHSPHFLFQDGCLIDVQGKRLIAFLSDKAEVTLPAGLTHIGDRAFEDCKKLTAITLPAGLTHIGDDAFRYCKNLTAITLPATLTHIGDGAFASSGIRSVVNHSPHFLFQDGCLIDVQGKRLIAFLSDKEEVTLPASLTHIGGGAFMGCKNLSAITLPAGLTHIGNSAFSGCGNLTAITLPAGLTHIGDWAFEGCKNLTDIHIPQGMTEHFKALLPPDLQSKLKELESLPKSPEGTLPENTNIFNKLKLYAAKPKLPEGALPGLFSINANGDKVCFAQGNLQYQATTRTWRFAEHQWDYVGDANSNIGAAYSGWIDLFGWGTGNNPTLASENESDYGIFVDWGKNAIAGGGSPAILWRTLTIDEWEYLLNKRANASTKKASGNVGGVHGLILLPDSWTLPSGCKFNACFASDREDWTHNSYTTNNLQILQDLLQNMEPEMEDWTHNSYTLAQWAKMEAAGAVFLPAAGNRLGKGVYGVGSYGFCWSSTPNTEFDAYYVNLGSDYSGTINDLRCTGQSVRLILDNN